MFELFKKRKKREYGSSNYKFETNLRSPFENSRIYVDDAGFHISYYVHRARTLDGSYDMRYRGYIVELWDCDIEDYIRLLEDCWERSKKISKGESLKVDISEYGIDQKVNFPKVILYKKSLTFVDEFDGILIDSKEKLTELTKELHRIKSLGEKKLKEINDKR